MFEADRIQYTPVAACFSCPEGRFGGRKARQTIRAACVGKSEEQFADALDRRVIDQLKRSASRLEINVLLSPIPAQGRGR